MRINRREFLKATVVAGAAVAVNGPLLNALAFAQKTPGEDSGTWIPSTCQGCTTWCPVEFFVQSGRATKVTGKSAQQGQ